MTEIEHSLEHQQAETLMDWLRLVFHADMGEDHLEHFAQGESLDVDISIDIAFDFDIDFQFFSSLAPIGETYKPSVFPPDIPIRIPQVDIDGQLLRGPPTTT